MRNKWTWKRRQQSNRQPSRSACMMLNEQLCNSNKHLFFRKYFPSFSPVHLVEQCAWCCSCFIRAYRAVNGTERNDGIAHYHAGERPTKFLYRVAVRDLSISGTVTPAMIARQNSIKTVDSKRMELEREEEIKQVFPRVRICLRIHVIQNFHVSCIAKQVGGNSTLINAKSRRRQLYGRVQRPEKVSR